jgi:hypothetical protein
LPCLAMRLHTSPGKLAFSLPKVWSYQQWPLVHLDQTYLSMRFNTFLIASLYDFLLQVKPCIFILSFYWKGPMKK